MRNTNKRHQLNKKGFSLIEVLIAVGILLLIIVPLTMNMISSSQMNAKAKETAVASDMSTSLVEAMQSLDLSDVMVEVNGYATNEYGSDIQYLLTSDALKGYKIDEMFEVITEDKITYVPVTKQEDVVQDYLVTSSVNTRNTGDSLRAYFTGQKSGNYAFVLKGVTSDAAKLDILVTMTPEAASNIVNTNSFNESEVESIRQDKNRATEMAQEFNRRNIAYIMQKGQGKSIPSISTDTYLKWMRRIVTVHIDQNPFTETTTIEVTETYIADAPAIYDSLETDTDRTITIQVGSFSTNSTTEFAKGVYYAYYPLLDEGDYKRDSFVVDNEHLLAVPCYFVALSDTQIKNYHPSIAVTEANGGSGIFGENTRTRICSNVENSLWTKKTTPSDLKLTIQSLGNASETQTMYTLNVNVYAHREDSFDDKNNFTPRDKDLLTNTNGSFIDRSESVDIDSDITTGLVTKPGVAQVIVQKLEYNEEIQGIKGVGVVFSGTHQAINAGTYTAYATPAKGYSWPDGTKTARPITWTINRRPLAYVTTNTGAVYNGELIEGVTGEYIDWGDMSEKSAVNAGTYTVYATPDSNHCWKDDKTYGTRTFVWNLYTKQLTVTWGERTWYYDGEPHSTTVTFSGTVKDDVCTATIVGNQITEVGEKEVSIIALSNKNYSIPKSAEKATLKVLAASSAEFEKNEVLNFEYDGTIHTCLNLASLTGVSISGVYQAKDAGNYVCYVMPTVGYTWADGTRKAIPIEWSIAKRPLGITFGTRQWVYDGLVHSTTISVSNIVTGDKVNVTVNNNFIQDVGTQQVTVNQPTNKNYVIAANTTTTLTVTRAPKAVARSSNYSYDGNTHAGVWGSYVKITGDSKAVDVHVVSDKIVAYTAWAEPLPNYSWADATNGEDIAPRKFTWYIYPKYDAWYKSANSIYTGHSMQFVWGANYNVLSGSEWQSEIGTYTVTIKPQTNHAWNFYTGEVGNNPIKALDITYYILDTKIYIPQLTQNELTYNGETQAAPIEWDMLSSFCFVEGDISQKDVGNYSLTMSLSNPSYTWADGSSGDKTIYWSIVPKEVTLTNNANTWTYDGDAHTATVQLTGLCGSDTCTMTYSNNTHTDASTNADNSYNFTVTQLSNRNYKLPATTTFKMFIKPRTVDIVWSTPREWNYDTTAKTVTATIGNKYGTNNWNINLTNNTHTDAGTYTVTASSLNTTNYVLPAANTTTMKINPIPSPISVANSTWNINCSKSAQTTTLSNASNYKGPLSYTIISQPSGNYFSLSGTTLTAAASTPAAQYTLTITAADAGNNNYTPVSKNFTITVTVSHPSEVNGGTENVHKKCSICGVTTQGKDSHSYSYSVDQYGNCVTNQIERATCACGYTYTWVSAYATGEHDYESSYTIDVARTCTKNGSKSRHCKNCSAKTDVTTLAYYHSWYGSTFYVNENNACVKKQYYGCGSCSYVVSTGQHSGTYVGGRESTCTTKGKTPDYKCANCGTMITRGGKLQPLLSHEYGKYTKVSGTHCSARCKWWVECKQEHAMPHWDDANGDKRCNRCGGTYTAAQMVM